MRYLRPFAAVLFLTTLPTSGVMRNATAQGEVVRQLVSQTNAIDARVKRCKGLLSKALKEADKQRSLLKEADKNYAEAIAMAPGLFVVLSKPQSEELKKRFWRQIQETLVEGNLWGLGKDLAVQQAVDIAAAVGVGEKLNERFQKLDKAMVAAKVDPAWAAVGDLYLAEFYFRTHQIKKMEEALTRLAPHIDAPAVAVRHRSAYWSSRGVLAVEQQKFALAIEYHERAVALAPDDSLKAQWRNNLGQAYWHMGDAKLALEYFQEAYDSHLAAYRTASTEEKEEIATALAITTINRAQASHAAGKAGAVSGLKKFMASPFWRFATKKASGGAVRGLAKNNLAMMFYNDGKVAVAEALFQEAILEYQQVHGTNSESVAELHVNLGWMQLEKGRPDLARSRFEKALVIFENQAGKEGLRTSECQAHLARVLANDPSQHRRAAKLLRESIESRTQLLHRTLGSALSERERLQFAQQTHQEAASWPSVLDTFLEIAPQVGITVSEQYQVVLNWKGALARSGLSAFEPSNPELREESRKRVAVLRDLRNLAHFLVVLEKTGQEIPQAVVSRQKTLVGDDRKLERKIRRLQLAAKPAVFRRVTPDDVRQAIPKKALWVDVAVYRTWKPGEAAPERQFVAFLTDGAKFERLEFGNAKLLEEAASKLWEEHQDTNSLVRKKPLTREGEESQEFVVDTFAKSIQKRMGDATLLIVSVEGQLHKLPMCALPGKASKYWIEETAFCRVASAHTLVAARRPRLDKELKLLLVGGINYGESASGKPKNGGVAATLGADGGNLWNPLPESGEELEVLVEMAKKSGEGRSVTVLTGCEATKQKTLAALAKQHVAHFCTHGYFLPPSQQPTSESASSALDASAYLDSGLVLAGANAAPIMSGDGLLTAEEIRHLPLESLEVVTLSACQTSLAHVRDGQGMVGLINAFEQAGAKSVIGALWDVDFPPTAELMKAFYQRLLAQKGERFHSAQALREAQLELIRGGKFKMPFHWAAWSVSGKP